MIRGDAMVGIEAIGRLKETIRRLSDLPRAIAVEAKPGLDKLLRAEFTSGADPYGRPWDPLKASTLAKGRRPPPLTDTRALRSGTKVQTRSGLRAGLVLLTGPHGYFHQVGFRVYRTRVAPRRVLPQYGLPIAWKKLLRDAARRCADLVAMFTAIFSDVATIRAARGLPPLISAHLGKEWIRAEETPPRIVVVPISTSYKPMRRMGAQPMQGLTSQVNPRPFFRRLLHFAAHFWGDESPTPSNPPTEQDLWYSYNSTIELEREFLGALMRNAGNDPAIYDSLSGEWVQPSDQNRLGRMLVLSFTIETPVTDEPWLLLPFAQSTGASGVSVLVDTAMVFPDGSSTDQGIFVIP
jgi:hypothetical protein